MRPIHAYNNIYIHVCDVFVHAGRIVITDDDGVLCILQIILYVYIYVIYLVAKTWSAASEGKQTNPVRIAF